MPPLFFSFFSFLLLQEFIKSIIIRLIIKKRVGVMEVIEQRPYRHFKGRLYFVHSIVENTEDGMIFVAYQAMYPPYKHYIRALEAFTENIDINRPDNITKQSKRFVLYDGKMNLF
jgi:hypothetical protein